VHRLVLRDAALMLMAPGSESRRRLGEQRARARCKDQNNQNIDLRWGVTHRPPRRGTGGRAGTRREILRELDAGRAGFGRETP